MRTSMEMPEQVHAQLVRTKAQLLFRHPHLPRLTKPIVLALPADMAPIHVVSPIGTAMP